jgi:hypothetical protein
VTAGAGDLDGAKTQSEQKVENNNNSFVRVLRFFKVLKYFFELFELQRFWDP